MGSNGLVSYSLCVGDGGGDGDGDGGRKSWMNMGNVPQSRADSLTSLYLPLRLCTATIVQLISNSKQHLIA